MTGASRTRSLFWTFAGVFLLVLAVASALQLVLSFAVIRPLTLAAFRDRAAAAMSRARPELLELSQPAADREIARVLRANRLDGGAGVLALFLPEGRFIPERPLPPEMPRQIHALAVDQGIVAPGGPPPERPPPTGMAGGPGPDGGPPTGGPPFAGRRPPGEEFDPPFAPRNRKLILLGSQRVQRNATLLGTLVAVGTEEASGPWGSPESRALLLFMPLAVLAAGAAGLVMVRLIARRIQALDRVAERVAAGDLAARVERTGADEIGMLEERFNRMTERLAAARDQLQRTDLERRRLFADITHELATPLTSIRGYVETLLDPLVPTTPEERSTYLHDVLDEAKRLDLLTSDLLDLVRLEAGAQPLVCVRLDWMALCRNVTRRFEPRFREVGLALCWTGPDAPAWVIADGRRIEQVIENLLANALRYVPPGGTVELQLTPAADGRWVLVVSDDGPGIADADLPHVFERFYRARGVRHQDGSGLGLAIVSEIVRRHTGAVRAERNVPRGARFVVVLPGAA